MDGWTLAFAQDAMESRNWTELAVLALASLAGAVLIYLSARYFYRGMAGSQHLLRSLIPAGLLATVIYQQSSVWPGFSLALMIALGIVHFRSVVRDQNDTLFVLWAILSGLFVGAGYPVPVLIIDLTLALTGLILARRRSLRITYLLLVRYDQAATEPLMAMLKPLHGVIVSQTDRNGTISLTVEIPLHSVNLTLVDAISAIEGVHHVVMINHEGNDPI